MKTTVELPDELLRKVRSIAARRGVPMRQVLSEAIENQITRETIGDISAPWLRHFGALQSQGRELDTLDRLVVEEFEQIDPEAW